MRPHPKGYRLTIRPDILSGLEVQPELNTTLFGREHYFYFKEMESTNDYAKILATQNYRRRTVVAECRLRAEKGTRLVFTTR